MSVGEAGQLRNGVLTATAPLCTFPHIRPHLLLFQPIVGVCDVLECKSKVWGSRRGGGCLEVPALSHALRSTGKDERMSRCGPTPRRAAEAPCEAGRGRGKRLHVVDGVWG